MQLLKKKITLREYTLSIHFLINSFLKTTPSLLTHIILINRIRLLSYYQLLPLSILCFTWTSELWSALVSSLLQYQILSLLLQGVFRTMPVKIYFMHCYWKNVKISHTNIDLFKHFAANTLSWNISLIPYNSHKNKPIWKYIHLKTSSD